MPASLREDNTLAATRTAVSNAPPLTPTHSARLTCEVPRHRLNPLHELGFGRAVLGRRGDRVGGKRGRAAPAWCLEREATSLFCQGFEVAMIPRVHMRLVLQEDIEAVSALILASAGERHRDAAKAVTRGTLHQQPASANSPFPPASAASSGTPASSQGWPPSPLTCRHAHTHPRPGTPAAPTDSLPSLRLPCSTAGCSQRCPL